MIKVKLLRSELYVPDSDLSPENLNLVRNNSVMYFPEVGNPDDLETDDGYENLFMGILYELADKNLMSPEQMGYVESLEYIDN